MLCEILCGDNYLTVLARNSSISLRNTHLFSAIFATVCVGFRGIMQTHKEISAPNRPYAHMSPQVAPDIPPEGIHHTNRIVEISITATDTTPAICPCLLVISTVIPHIPAL